MPIEIFGVNDARHARGNDLIDAMERDLPWLQDSDAQDVWNRWSPEYRDLVILDRSNRQVAVFNLTIHDIGQPDELATLRALLLEVAGVSED